MVLKNPENIFVPAAKQLCMYPKTNTAFVKKKKKNKQKDLQGKAQASIKISAAAIKWNQTMSQSSNEILKSFPRGAITANGRLAAISITLQGDSSVAI